VEDGRVVDGGALSPSEPGRLAADAPSPAARRWADVPLAEPISRLTGGLIVSCQASPQDPLYGPTIMAALARAAARGGAVAIRANGPDDIASIREAVDLPIIGIWKVALPGVGIRITPALNYARAVAAAGASIIALDATDRDRSDGLAVSDLIARVRDETGLPVMADVSSVAEGLMAEAAGASLIATTLAGYTDVGPPTAGPDLGLVAELAPQLRVPLVAEGRISTPEEAAMAIEMGAFAVVVGHAITRPEWITSRFVAALSAR
jgi:N-acylglucosamine-6-phosphate 2-epimerase